MTTILYITNKGSEIPLRYSLRTLHNIEHHNVVVSGYLPSYAQNVKHVPGEDDTALRDINIQRKLLAGLKCPSTKPEVVLMCDDIYLLAPYTDPRTRYKGLLKDRIAAIQKRPETDEFRRTMEATLRCLDAMGVVDALDFGCHHPVYMDRKKAIETVEFSLSREVPVCITTLYHYMHGSEVAKGPQAKALTWTNGLRGWGGVYSSSDHIEGNYGFKEYMHLNFSASRYEKIS